VAGSGSIQGLVRDSRGKRGAGSHACKRRRRSLVVHMICSASRQYQDWKAIRKAEKILHTQTSC